MMKIVVKSTDPELVLFDEYSSQHDAQIAAAYADTFEPIYKRLRSLAPSFSFEVLRSWINGNSAPDPYAIMTAVFKANNGDRDTVAVNGIDRPLASVINTATADDLAPYAEIRDQIKHRREVLRVGSTAVYADGDELAVNYDAINAMYTYTMSADALAYYNALNELAAAFNTFAQKVIARSVPHVYGLTHTPGGWRVDLEWVLFNLPHKTQN